MHTRRSSFRYPCLGASVKVGGRATHFQKNMPPTFMGLAGTWVIGPYSVPCIHLTALRADFDAIRPHIGLAHIGLMDPCGSWTHVGPRVLGCSGSRLIGKLVRISQCAHPSPLPEIHRKSTPEIHAAFLLGVPSDSESHHVYFLFVVGGRSRVRVPFPPRRQICFSAFCRTVPRKEGEGWGPKFVRQ